MFRVQQAGGGAKRVLGARGECHKPQTVCWILAAWKGWIKQTYRKIMHTQNTQNHITGNDLVDKYHYRRQFAVLNLSFNINAN